MERRKVWKRKKERKKRGLERGVNCTFPFFENKMESADKERKRRKREDRTFSIEKAVEEEGRVAEERERRG